MRKCLWVYVLFIPFFLVLPSCQNTNKIIINDKDISTFGKEQDAFFTSLTEDTLAQHYTIKEMYKNLDYMINRASFYYFQQSFQNILEKMNFPK